MRARSLLSALAPEAPLERVAATPGSVDRKFPRLLHGRPVVLDLNIPKPKVGEIAGLVSELAARGIRVYAIEANGIDTLGPDLPPLLIGAKETVDRGTTGGSRSGAKPAARHQLNRTAVAKRADHRCADSLRPVGLSSRWRCDRPWLGRLRLRNLRRRLRSTSTAPCADAPSPGPTGNGDARIFCRKNEAELSGGGYGWYRTAEEIEIVSRGRPYRPISPTA